MDQLVLNLLPGLVLGGSVATITMILIGLHRGLMRAGWPVPERQRTTTIFGVVLAGWFLAELVPARLGFYRAAAAGLPTIPFGLLIPILVGVAVFWQGKLLRRVVDAMPQRWIAGIQLFRVEGAIFLILLAVGKLPGEFAKPAGWGDVAVGLLAPAVGMYYARNPKAGAGWLRAWNLLGLLDLTVAVTTGFLTSPSPLQKLALDRPNELIGAFPLVMIPVFLVPLAVLLHLASLQKLRSGKTEIIGVSARGMAKAESV